MSINFLSSSSIYPVRNNNLATPEKSKKNSDIAANRLPPEVLSRIMLIGVESDRRVWKWGSRKLESQETASHVCRYWRDVASNTLMLWTFIRFAINIPTQRNILYLRRTGSTAPLDITIDLRLTVEPLHWEKEKSDRDAFLSGIHEALTAQDVQDARWRSLLVHTYRLAGDTSSDLTSCLGQLQRVVPNLQGLRFDYGFRMNAGCRRNAPK
ncbi:hypothetical protein B0J17DRAFT_722798 [Rhizoctonia solani]|nr:hypothetical protein B0J17DRAFT_722798 [Rhizoctonia solani]